MLSAALQAWCEMFPDYGETVSTIQAKLYARTLDDVPPKLLSAGLKLATQECTRFPLPGDVLKAVDRVRAEHGQQVATKRLARQCEACDGAGWVSVTIRGVSAVKPCHCRPAPPREQLRSPQTPVFGLAREIRQVAEGMGL